MTPENFTSWMRGFLAALGGATMTAAQLETVRQELAKVAPAPYPWTLTVLPVQPYQPYQPPVVVYTGDSVLYKGVAGGGAVGGLWDQAAKNPNFTTACAPNPSFGAFTGFANAACAAPAPSFTINISGEES